MSDSPVLFDANVWIALAFAAHPHHAIAQSAFLAMTPARPAVFCRATQQSFLRLASTPTILRLCNATGLTNRDALGMLNGFMASPSIAYHQEPVGIESIWHNLAAIPSASPHVWMDAYLAAFAIADSLELLTFDKGMSQYPGVRVLVLGTQHA